MVFPTIHHQGTKFLDLLDIYGIDENHISTDQFLIGMHNTRPIMQKFVLSVDKENTLPAH